MTDAIRKRLGRSDERRLFAERVALWWRMRRSRRS